MTYTMNIEKFISPMECFSMMIDLVSFWTILNNLDFWFFFLIKTHLKNPRSEFTNFLISHGCISIETKNFLVSSIGHAYKCTCKPSWPTAHLLHHIHRLPASGPPHLSPFRSWWLPNSETWKDIEPRDCVRLICSIKDKWGKSFTISFV